MDRTLPSAPEFSCAGKLIGRHPRGIASSGDELWTLQLYAIDYDAHMEEYVQDIYGEVLHGR